MVITKLFSFTRGKPLKYLCIVATNLFLLTGEHHLTVEIVKGQEPCVVMISLSYFETQCSYLGY